MSHPNLKAGITHCGLGGTLEFINSEIPCMVFPHCGDQPMNATNLIERGAAIPLIDISKSQRPSGGDTQSFNEPVFTADHLADGLFKLLTDPSYKEKISTMKVAAVGAGGGQRAEQAIRDFYV